MEGAMGERERWIGRVNDSNGRNTDQWFSTEEDEQQQKKQDTTTINKRVKVAKGLTNIITTDDYSNTDKWQTERHSNKTRRTWYKKCHNQNELQIVMTVRVDTHVCIITHLGLWGTLWNERQLPNASSCPHLRLEGSTNHSPPAQRIVHVLNI